MQLKLKPELLKSMDENEVWTELVNVLFMNMKQEPENGTKNMHYA